MKRLTFCCRGCGRTKQFSGLTVEAIIRAIDKAGWVDEPGKQWCPKCWAEKEKEWR